MTNFETFLFYECPECTYKSQDRNTFARHAASTHTLQASDLLKRMVDNGTISIELPDVKIITPPKKLNEAVKYPKDNSVVQCYVCGEENSDKANIIDHIRTKHFENVKVSMYGTSRDFQCQQCKIMYATNGALGLHICGELPPRWSGDYNSAKKCPECGKIYKKRYDMLSHIAKVHTGAKNFACPDCDYKASVPFLLKKHIRRKHGSQDKTHLCQDCGAAFSERTHLLSHIKYVHKLNKEDTFWYVAHVQNVNKQLSFSQKL